MAKGSRKSSMPETRILVSNADILVCLSKSPTAAEMTVGPTKGHGNQ
jgi:hypothetical protein